MTSFFTGIKTRFNKLAKENSSLDEVDARVASGAFTGVFPSFGFGFLTLLPLQRFFKFNIFSTAKGSLISYPLTIPLFMLLSIETGGLLLNTDVRFDTHHWYANLKEAVNPIFIGVIAVSIFCNFATYIIPGSIVVQIRNKENKPYEYGLVKISM
jgi:uncharacterized protein (DUF2062 family)